MNARTPSAKSAEPNASSRNASNSASNAGSSGALFQFLTAFLDGKTSAGEALLKSRRSLLAMNNPLGLAYTLYGSSNLTLNIA